MLKSPATSDLVPSFAPDFLEDHARRIIRDPKIALVEIVANCWDAGADTVKITWPEEGRPDPIVIEDNGSGMTYEQFCERWLQLKYNRKEAQGELVNFPDGNKRSHRKAYGRNGKGRHSMFCFASEYFVETWRNGEGNKFRVERTGVIAQMPYRITHLERFRKSGNGTIISAILGRNFLSISDLYDLLGSKFVTDPTFEAYVNGELVELTNLEHLINARSVNVPGIGTVIVSQVDTQKTSRTSRQHGVAWWVNKRLVGEPSWEDFEREGLIDKRTINAKRYTFVVDASVLVKEVEEDWSGFFDNDNVRSVRARVKEHIRQRLLDLMQDIHRTRKRIAIEANQKVIKTLPSDSRYYLGKSIDGMLAKMPALKPEVLSATLDVLSNLEKARSGYTLLEQLAQLRPDELDQLSDILAEWSILEARVVLSELERRLKIIERLEELVNNPSSDELHEIQPLFKQGLWMFGPEYESVHYSSNQTLLTVVRDLIQSELRTPLTNSRRRPDFVVLPDSTLGLYASDSFDERAEVNGYSKILIIELKRGGSTIYLKEHRQGENYALELVKSGKVQSFSKLEVFVIGTEVDAEAREDLNRGNIKVSARAYGVVLRQAHARTFNLLEKIKEAKNLELYDPDVEEAIEDPLQQAKATVN